MKTQNKKPQSKKITTFLWISIPIFLILTAGIIIGIVLFTKPTYKEQALISLESALTVPSIFSEEDPPEMILRVEQKNGYELIALEEQDHFVVGTFHVFAPDLYAVAKTVDKIDPDSKNLEKTVLDELNSAPIVEKEVSLVFEKTEAGLSPILTSDFIDAYYGGAYRLYEEYLLILAKEAK